MNCCVRCFIDADIQARIETLNIKGNCDFCGTQNVWVLDVTRASERGSYAKGFAADFEDLLDQFTTDINDELRDRARRLSDYLEDLTNSFRLPDAKILSLLRALLPQKYDEDPALFDNLVIPRYLTNSDLELKRGVFKGKTWQEFEADVKWNNRFYSKLPNVDVLISIFSRCVIDVASGERFYRARISSNGGSIPANEMGCAPRGLATSGRLNASGIGYLYLCSSSETTLAEIKAAAGDVCTIATFVVNPVKNEKLRVVDLSQISQLGVFGSEDEKDIFLMNHDILSDIDFAMRKSSGRNRSEIEYAPTEYLSDMIKSMGVDGIRYKSTLDQSVVDMVLFNDDKVAQLENELTSCKIEKLQYIKKNLDRN